MNEKAKSSPKAKVLTVVILVLFLGSCAVLVFAIINGNFSRNNNNNTDPTYPSSTVLETAAVTETAADTEATQITTVTTAVTEAKEFETSLGSTYDVDYWVEYKAEYGTHGIGVLFGAHATGATVSFSDGKFAVTVIGSNETLEVASGTFSFISESEIQLRYDNSNIETAKVVEEENGVVTVMDFPMDVSDTTLRISLSQ